MRSLAKNHSTRTFIYTKPISLLQNGSMRVDFLARSTMPPLNEGSGQTCALQNGNVITVCSTRSFDAHYVLIYLQLELSKPPSEYPKDPIPAQPKKKEAKTCTYPEYSRALYDLNAQSKWIISLPSCFIS